MKKILLGMGVVAAATPLAVIISCSDDNKKENVFKTDAVKIANAFNATTGGKIVTEQWVVLATEQARIDALTDATKKEAAQTSFYKNISEGFKDIVITTANKLSYETLKGNADNFKNLFGKLKTEIDEVTTDKEAEKYGLKTVDEAKKVSAVADKLANVVKETKIADNKDNIVIGIPLIEDAEKIMPYFFSATGEDASSEWFEITRFWDAIKDKSSNDADYKEFIVGVSEALALQNGTFSNTYFIHTIDGQKKTEIKNTWNAIFDKIKEIGASFTDSKDAIAYGYPSLERALKGSQMADQFRKLNEGTDYANNITIYEA